MSRHAPATGAAAPGQGRRARDAPAGAGSSGRDASGSHRDPAALRAAGEPPACEHGLRLARPRRSTRMWRNRQTHRPQKPAGHSAMGVRLPPSALTGACARAPAARHCLRSSAEEQRASNPGAEVRLLSGALTTPWPSGEARACKARYGGSSPPGVFSTTMERRDDERSRRSARSTSAASSSSSAAWRPATPSTACSAPTTTRATASRSAAASPTRATSRRPASATTSAAATRPCAPSSPGPISTRSAASSGHARDHAPDLVRHGRAGARAGRPSGARQDPHGRVRAAAQARASSPSRSSAPSARATTTST